MFDYTSEGTLQEYLNEEYYTKILTLNGLTVILTSGNTLTNEKVKNIIPIKLSNKCKK